MPISLVYLSKRDTAPIQPKDLDDFDPNKKYYITWIDEQSRSEEKYPGYMVCLGVTEEDAKEKASNKKKRVIVRRKLTSTDTTSSEEDVENNENVGNRRKQQKVFKVFSQKETSKRILEEYKCKVFLDNRRSLNLLSDNDTDVEKSSMVKSSDPLADIHINNADGIVSRPQKARKTFLNKALQSQLNFQNQSLSPRHSRSRSSSSERRSLEAMLFSVPSQPNITVLESDSRGTVNHSSNANKAHSVRRCLQLSFEEQNHIESEKDDHETHTNTNEENGSNILNEQSSETDVDDDENMQCESLYVYKNKLFKMYKKKKYDLTTVIEEPYSRYQKIDDDQNIYLGEGVKAGSKSWHLSHSKKILVFCEI